MIKCPKVQRSEQQNAYFCNFLILVFNLEIEVHFLVDKPFNIKDIKDRATKRYFFVLRRQTWTFHARPGIRGSGPQED